MVQTLRTGARKTVRTGGSDARFLSTGHLIYSVGGIVFAAPFDVGAAELRGEAVPVVEGVRRCTSGVLLLAVSDSGVLAYQPGPAGADQGFADSRLVTAPAPSRTCRCRGGVHPRARVA